MSLAESQAIKPLIEIMERLLREWLIADKEMKGDKYGLKKMLVRLTPASVMFAFWRTSTKGRSDFFHPFYYSLESFLRKKERRN